MLDERTELGHPVQMIFPRPNNGLGLDTEVRSSLSIPLMSGSNMSERDIVRGNNLYNDLRLLFSTPSFMVVDGEEYPIGV